MSRVDDRLGEFQVLFSLCVTIEWNFCQTNHHFNYEMHILQSTGVVNWWR